MIHLRSIFTVHLKLNQTLVDVKLKEKRFAVNKEAKCFYCKVLEVVLVVLIVARHHAMNHLALSTIASFVFTLF